MPSIYLAAIIATMLAVIIIGTIVLKILKKNLFLLLPFSIFFLPMSYITFTFIRVPIVKFVINCFKIPQTVTAWPLWYVALVLLYAPVTEELIKLLPLFLSWIRKKISFNNRIAIGLMIGLGFGIGELWLVASWFSRNVYIAGYHWYQLWGYILERLISCFSHGVFTTVALKGLGNKFTKYIIYAIGLHALSNLPIVMSRLGVIKLSTIVFQNISLLYLLLFLIFLIFILSRLIKNDSLQDDY